MLAAGRELEVVRHTPASLAQHDVDRARNRTGSGLGGRGTQDFDALDLFRRELLDGEPGRHTLSIQQDLRVTVAQAPHADRATTSRRAAHGDTRQAFEHIGNRGITLLLDLFATNDNLAGRGLAPGFGVVVAVAADFDAPQVGHAGRGSLRQRRQTGRKQTGQSERLHQRSRDRDQDFRHAPILTADPDRHLKQG